MTVTITAGITFSGGGLTMSFAPPSIPTAGWYGGGVLQGGTTVSYIQRILFATDTDTATVRGNFTNELTHGSGTGTTTNGWFGGGLFGYPSILVSTVQRITYATDTATTSVRGTLVEAIRNTASTSDGTTYGWFAGGASQSTVSRITYATDTATASTRGTLIVAAYLLGATGTITDGWFGGGYAPTSIVSRITYATDTATASQRGPLSAARYGLAAAGDNTTYGWYAGGLPVWGSPKIYVSTIDRITYATDTATASVRGPLSWAREKFTASTDNTYGWFGGGTNAGAGGVRSTVDRITYATDTATASTRGPLSSAVYNPAGATSGVA